MRVIVPIVIYRKQPDSKRLLGLSLTYVNYMWHSIAVTVREASVRCVAVASYLTAFLFLG